MGLRRWTHDLVAGLIDNDSYIIKAGLEVHDMESLEQAARLEWELMHETEDWVQKERVALGFVGLEVEGFESVWYELANTADQTIARADGRGEFFVEGSELQRIMEIAHAEGLSKAVRILWHTHTEDPSPSAEDIAEFPTWLADAGAVYHVPTGSTTLYNAAGIISDSILSPTSLSTGGN